MANAVIILGKSGTGKSSSIRGLDSKETVILNLLGKRLPFKGSNAVYNVENKNLFQVETHADIINMLESINTKAPYVKNVIIDDAIYMMRKEYFNRAKESGLVA